VTPLETMAKAQSNVIKRILVSLEEKMVQKNQEEIERKLRKNPNQMFSLLKKVNPKKIKEALSGNQKMTDPIQVKTVVQDHFSSVFSSKFNDPEKQKKINELQNFLKSHKIPSADSPAILKVSKNMLKKIINEKQNSSPGPSKISYALMKHFIKHKGALDLLESFYSLLLKHNIIPDGWKNATTILLPKCADNLLKVENWRPITLLHVEYKILSEIVNVAICKLCKKYNLIPSSQCGFQKDKSIFMCVKTMVEILKNAHSEGTRSVYRLCKSIRYN
jgi:hypothetical protein